MAKKATRAEISDDKDEARKDALKKLNEKYGKGTIMKFSERTDDTTIHVIPSGCLNLDLALGRGGYPRGRIIEIMGPEASGKTTLTLHAIAEAQKLGEACAFIDAEHALDTDYARALGVDVDSLFISQPDNGEQALDIVEELVRSKAFGFIVVDSVAALVPKAEIDGEMGSTTMGSHARLMSQAMRKLTGIVHTSNTVLFFVNQIRMKIGVMFGSPETTTGGNALKFYASVRLDIRKKTAIKDGEIVIGNQTEVKVIKNKVAPPFRVAMFNIMYGKGVDRLSEVIDFSVHLGLLGKAGAWYSYNGENVAKGKPALQTYLTENPDLVKSLETQISAHYHKNATSASELKAGEEAEPGADFDPVTGEFEE